LEKLLKGVNYLSLSLLAISLGLFVSSLFGYKIKTEKFSLFSSFSCEERKLSYDFFVEREGFFKPVKVVKKETKRIPIEETLSLNDYTLKGTVVCSRCGHSIAILEKGKVTKIVGEGEVFNGYRLKKVYPDRVIFSKSGRDIVLLLNRPKNKMPISEVNKEKLPAEKRFFVKRSEVLEEISTGRFLRYINIVPVDNPPGLKVNYVNPRSFIYKLGIRPGDIIISINDIRIRTPEDSFSAFEKLKNSDSITIEIIRNGRKQRLNYELE